MSRKQSLCITGCKTTIFILAIAFASIALTGCWVDDRPLTGTFGDSPVTGLQYETPTLSGTTNDHGTFRYASGESVSFSIGGLTIGTTAGAETLTALDLVDGAADAGDQSVNNILLQRQNSVGLGYRGVSHSILMSDFGQRQ